MIAIKDTLDIKQSIAPAAYNATVTGSTIDMANYGSNMIEFIVGAITDGTHTPKLQDSPDGTTWSDVTASNQSGTLAALASGVNQKVSYIGGQRYLRSVVTVAGATTGGVYSVVAASGKKRKQP